MTSDLRLALRDLGRNRRRSVATMLAVACSCGGLTLFGGYVSWIFRGVELQAVNTSGHIQVHKRGYSQHGAGNPSGYTLGNYTELRRLLLADAVLGPRLELVTGQLLFSGIVQSPATKAASTFIGLGVFPSEDDRVLRWDPYGLWPAMKLKANAALFEGVSEMDDADPRGGSVGPGLGQTLGFAGVQAAPASRPVIDLMVALPDRSLNVEKLEVRKVMPRGIKELDEQLIKLPAALASKLLFPRSPLQVSAVVLLLKRTDDLELAARRLAELNQQGGLDLEFRLFHEIRPFYGQVRRMLGITFIFVFTLLAMLVAVTVFNAQSAGVIERLNELGTLRALGVKRIRIWRLLLLEGTLLGLFGGLLGVVLGVLGDLALRASDVVYVPPGSSFYVKVEVLVLRDPVVALVAFTGAVACAVLASVWPARQAALTPIVDALRHR